MSPSDLSGHNRKFPFQMLKEVYEQPEAIRQTIHQHIDPATVLSAPTASPGRPPKSPVCGASPSSPAAPVAMPDSAAN